MSRHDVIIIGAGVNGLTAAAYLAKAGLDVLVLERRWETGGAVMTDEQSGVRFNTHAIYMMMAELMPPYSDLGLHGKGCVFKRPEPKFSLITEDGKALTLYEDPKKSCESIRKFSEKDATAFEKMYRDFKEMSDNILIPQTYRPPLPPTDVTVMLQESELGRAFLEIAEDSPVEIIEKYGFENELVKSSLLYLFCMWGMHPEEPGLGFLFPLYVYRMLNAAFVVGGSHRLTSALVKVLYEHGGKVEETAEVDRILVEGEAVAGVRTVDGRTFESKIVASSVDPVQTFLRFFERETLEKLSPEMIDVAERWEWEACSLYGLHLVTNVRPEFEAAKFDVEVNNSFIQLLGVESVEDVVKEAGKVREGELAESFHLTTMTRFDKTQAPSMIAKFAPREAPPGILEVIRIETIAPFEPKEGDWETLKDRYADEILVELQNYAPNMKEGRIIRRYPYPPTYIEQKFINMKRGSIKHGEYTSTQLGYMRPDIECSSCRTPIKGLYLCGASVYPGGMVTMGPGYLAANAIAEDLGIDKWWSLPENVKRAIEMGFAR